MAVFHDLLYFSSSIQNKKTLVEDVFERDNFFILSKNVYAVEDEEGVFLYPFLTHAPSTGAEFGVSENKSF